MLYREINNSLNVLLCFSCCVDEVAAEHYKADSLIHYGRSCLSATQRLPLRYVFSHQPLDVTDCVSNFTRLVDDPSQPVILIYDVVYHHKTGQLHHKTHQIDRPRRLLGKVCAQISHGIWYVFFI